MRDPVSTVKAALAAGAILALAACGGEPAANTEAGNELDANMTLEEPANDASAMEAVGNAAETPPPEENAADDAEGETEGGDTGGNNVESNTVGM
jgi:hypothetical protein